MKRKGVSATRHRKKEDALTFREPRIGKKERKQISGTRTYRIIFSDHTRLHFYNLFVAGPQKNWLCSRPLSFHMVDALGGIMMRTSMRMNSNV